MIPKLIIVLIGLIVISEIITAESVAPTENTQLKTNPLVCARCIKQCPCRKLPLTKICDKYYYVGTHYKLNWFEANQYCRRHGMYLASLQTEEENDDLINYLTNEDICVGRFWTSGNDLGQEGIYYWMTNGEKFSFTNWEEGQPNNERRRQHCVELTGTADKPYVWNDYRCSKRLHFICEI